MSKKVFITLLLVISSVVFASCSKKSSTPPPDANMPNPASVFCEENGGKLELRTDAQGNVAGICVFADGSECDEWAYFRKECQPGGAPVVEPTPTTQPGGPAAGWVLYRDDRLGYSFEYPADAVIGTNDDPLKGLSITGPLIGGDNWPMIVINHPADREDFRPPEGTNLAQWLTDHNLLPENLLQDVQIAGTLAVHLRYERSPQSYAYDRYLFAHAGQLYELVILHTGEKEDWELYNHFLNSIRFDK